MHNPCRGRQAQEGLWEIEFLTVERVLATTAVSYIISISFTPLGLNKPNDKIQQYGSGNAIIQTSTDPRLDPPSNHQTLSTLITKGQ